MLAAKTTLPEQEYWVLATMAEAHTGLLQEDKAQDFLNQAQALGQPKWMLASTLEQLESLKKLLTRA